MSDVDVAADERRHTNHNNPGAETLRSERSEAYLVGDGAD
jgi:hypothetical protein